ncbi:MAG: nucleoside monophosphate kinase, partial [Pseudolabrys sp.]
AKSVMERGELVPDDVVVAIIADRIGQRDAKRGFVLDGFPRTVAQAEALDRFLAERGLELDAVVELKVDESILLQRIEKRVAEMSARGEKVRPDDNPEVLKGRLSAYKAQTAPLVDYYAGKGMLKSVNGMVAIDAVTGAVMGHLAPLAPLVPRGGGSVRRKVKTRKTAKRPAAKASARRKRSAPKKRNKVGKAKNRTRRRLTRA